MTFSTPSPGMVRRHCNPGQAGSWSLQCTLACSAALTHLWGGPGPLPVISDINLVAVVGSSQPTDWSSPAVPLLTPVPPCTPEEGAGLSEAPAQRHPGQAARTQETRAPRGSCAVTGLPPDSRWEGSVSVLRALAPRLSCWSLLKSSGPQVVVPASCCNKTAAVGSVKDMPVSLPGRCGPRFAPSPPRAPGPSALPSQLPPAPHPPHPPRPGRS